ncbi:DUF1553 domain-containing protein [Planctomicrobium sp. SH668]|uniref:DUF1553 domain-containing protein n=1 Tax=Planctomicrobium sp. SH668 TaxID=3448126 RepID=UPI003F5BA6AA
MSTGADSPASLAGHRVIIVRCLDCHGTDQSGGLDLRTAATALKGGESGAAIVPGKVSESLLIDYVETQTMPPKHPLTDEEIDALKKWVEAGAEFPDKPLDPYAFSNEARAGYDWWSLQSIVPHPIPQVRESQRISSPIDAFIISKLEENALTLSPEASREEFIRRVTFDLTGLAPTYEEIQQFTADLAPGAHERLVDRLLASPHYGEHWGRHWLDVVRFAESNGFERDRLRTNFWHYRDYVIRAFNNDVPYNDFVQQQLAGDTLDPANPENRIATGFLVAGPKNDVDTVSELETMITRQDELDEYVSAVGTTFLGMTVGCARCHDHKFDPIPTRDYYAMTAIFSGLNHSNEIIATPEEKETYDKQVGEIQQRLAKIDAAISSVLNEGRQQLASESKQSTYDLPPLTAQLNEDTFEAIEARFVRFSIGATMQGSQPCIDELEIYGPESESNLALASAGSKATASSELSGFDIHRIDHLNDGQAGNSRSWISGTSNIGWAQIELPQIQLVSRIVWGRDREGRFVDRLPTVYQLEVSLDGKDWKLVSQSTRRPPIDSNSMQSNEAIAASLSGRLKEQHQKLQFEREQTQQERDRVPALPISYIAITNTPLPTFVLNRGNVRSPEEAVQPATFSAVSQLNPVLSLRDGNNSASRRKAFADWITDSKNPLTARVWVNRVWQYHFGQGLVSSPNDFGFNGDQPTHPQLLDWLADDFMAQGWTTKRLHKMIVLSSTYRQSSANRPEASSIDAGNRLLWRYSPQRLTSESVRDRILQVSGSLNRELFGPSYRLFTYVDGNVPDYVLLDRPGPETWRRSVYNFNIRTFSSPLMSAFDCPDPSVQTPVRGRSTTALQALSLMNGQFIFEQGTLLADKIKNAHSEDPEGQVSAAYRAILGRDPDVNELQLSQSFLTEHGLFSLCRVLFNTNEFLYVY